MQTLVIFCLYAVGTLLLLGVPSYFLFVRPVSLGSKEIDTVNTNGEIGNVLVQRGQGRAKSMVFSPRTKQADREYADNE